MVTSTDGGEDGGPYRGGGTGGKFRKKPFRRTQTPYDRPPAVQRGICSPTNVDNNYGGLFTKLVLDPASKLISYGAHRFFASVFRKSLPPPPQRAPEVNDHVKDELQVSDSNYGEKKPRDDGNSQPLHDSTGNGISELEQLLKQSTFSRSEIVHLTSLLHSRAAVELSPRLDLHMSEETPSELGMHKSFLSSSLELNIKDDDASHVVNTTPIPKSGIIGHDRASPAELAKAYMGTRPSEISPMHSQFEREDTGLLGSAPFGSKPPNKSLTNKKSVGVAAPSSGYTGPKSRGRSALYDMARTPYSRIHQLPAGKGIGLTNSGYSGQPMSVLPYPQLVHNEKLEAKTTTPKRRSSVLDDDVGSVGPIRRIRQKPNLLGSRVPVTTHGVEIGSDYFPVSSNQKLPLIVQPKMRVSKLHHENEDYDAPSARHSHVPSKSSEVAAKILQHLEKLTPKEKSSKSKLGIVQEKSPFRLTPNMLSGRALRSMENVESYNLLHGVEDDPNLEDRSTAYLTATQDSTFENPGKLLEDSPKESGGVLDLVNPVMKNNFESLKAPVFSSGTSNSNAQNGVAQTLHNNKAFRMSAQEDFIEQDDDEICNGVAPKSVTEDIGQARASVVGYDISPAEESKAVKTSVQPKMMLPFSLASETSNCGVITIREESSDAVLSEEKANATVQSEVLHPASLFNKENEINSSLSLPNSISKTVDNPLFSKTKSENPESKPVFNSLANVISSAAGSQTKIAESENNAVLNFLTSGGVHTKDSSAVNGPPISMPSIFSTDANKMLMTASSSFLTSSNDISSLSSFVNSTVSIPSSSIAGFGPTRAQTVSASGGNLFGSNGPPSIFGETVFKSGDSFNKSSAVVAASGTISELTDLKTKSEKGPNFDSSNGTDSNVVSFATANSGSSLSGFSTSASSLIANNLQGSHFGSSVTGLGMGLHGTSLQFGPSASSPLLNVSSSTTFGNSLSGFKVNPNRSFCSSSAASSVETSIVNSSSGPTSTVGKVVLDSSVSDGNAVCSSSSTTPGISSFGSGSFTSASAGSSSNGVIPSIFKSVSNSVVASETKAASTLSSITASIPFGFTSPSPTPSPSPSTSTGFAFGTSSVTVAPTTAASMSFNSNAGPSSSPIFSFTSSSLPSITSSSLNLPTFVNKPFSSVASPLNGDQMYAEDRMAEDPVQTSTLSIPEQTSTLSIPIFGQPIMSLSPPTFMFGASVPSVSNPYQFGVQQNQIAPQNPSPFQASGSQEFNAGGSFSLGSSGADKSNRKFVKVSRNKNRKK